MTYYHLRYNVYEKAGYPVEKERWIQSDLPLDDTKAREHLEQEHQYQVSIITWKVICLEEFEMSHVKAL
jgi:hypothetical protein